MYRTANAQQIQAADSTNPGPSCSSTFINMIRTSELMSNLDTTMLSNTFGKSPYIEASNESGTNTSVMRDCSLQIVEGNVLS